MHNPAELLHTILEDKATVPGGSAYADLDLLYRDAFSVTPGLDVAQLVVGVIYCMAIALSISALHKLLQQPNVDVRIVIPILNSVLLAPEDGKQPTQFYHASFRDSPIDPRRSQKYAINPDVYHRLMAQLCVEMMSNSMKRGVCSIVDPAKANNDLAERRQAASDEALSYAYRFFTGFPIHIVHFIPQAHSTIASKIVNCSAAPHTSSLLRKRCEERPRVRQSRISVKYDENQDSNRRSAQTSFQICTPHLTHHFPLYLNGVAYVFHPSINVSIKIFRISSLSSISPGRGSSTETCVNTSNDHHRQEASLSTNHV